MRHLLVVAYHTPPVGGVPVRRVLRFLRHLPESGWRCSLLTADAPYDPFHPNDPSGVRDLPPVERVIRCPARSGLERLLVHGYEQLRRVPRSSEARPESGPAGGRLRKLIYDTIAFPDPKWPWARVATRRALEMARVDPPDAILATAYPWSALSVAARLGGKLGVPMLLDYRDAWSLNPRGLWDSARQIALESQITSKASLILAASDWIRDRMRERFTGLAPERIVTLRNGYDPQEFPAADPSLRDPAQLIVTYTGTFNDALPPSPMDQSPYYLFQALAKLPDRVRARLRVRIVARHSPPYREYAQRLGIDDVVEFVGPVPHRRALQFQLASDVLLLLLSSELGRGGVLTGKLMEYVGAQRPILALAPRGEASDLILKHDLGRVVPPEQIEAIACAFEGLVEDWRANRLRPTDAVPELDASRLTGELAAHLDGATQS